MKNLKTIILMNEVTGTVTNDEGLALFLAIDKELREGNGVRLSLEKATTFSSSFLNSSIGELVVKFGIETIKSNLIIVNYQPSRLNQIRAYIEKIMDLA